jgi:hypothetical protein
MRLIVSTEPGVVELNYMWLPTFIGLDNNLKAQLEEKLAPSLVGKELSDDLLDEVSEKAMDLICEHYPLEGLRDYLDAIKFVGS